MKNSTLTPTPTPVAAAKTLTWSLTVCLYLISLLRQFYQCWTTQLLWTWFLTPVIGLAAPSVAMLYGMLLMFGVFFGLSPWASLRATADKYETDLNISKQEKPFVVEIALGITITTILATGWILQALM